MTSTRNRSTAPSGNIAELQRTLAIGWRLIGRHVCRCNASLRLTRWLFALALPWLVAAALLAATEALASLHS